MSKQEELEDDQAAPTIGKEMKWELRDWARHDWHLMMDTKEMTLLVATGPLNSKFEAVLGNKRITITYQEKSDRTTFMDSST